ncbi:MAG TPA: hypothetical protein VHZ56_10185, partial [Devosia sp.]|nr:hypothetical protein [Devosia sp.]
MPDVAPSPALVRAALDELLAWQGIARSPQLSQLLRYVVEKALSGDGGSIKAYSIAVDVFGRPATFDPQADPIVRVQARRLRTLLEQFYETGQARAAVQIHLPLGRYVPEFHMPGAQGIADSAGVLAPADVAAAPVGRRSSLARFLRSALLALCFTLIGVALAVAIIRWTLPPTTPAAAPDVPKVAVGTFDNLTGDAKLDGLVEQFSSDVARGLAQFETVEVAGGGSIVQGAMQRTDGRYSIGAVLGGG